MIIEVLNCPKNTVTIMKHHCSIQEFQFTLARLFLLIYAWVFYGASVLPASTMMDKQTNEEVISMCQTAGNKNNKFPVHFLWVRMVYFLLKIRGTFKSKTDWALTSQSHSFINQRLLTSYTNFKSTFSNILFKFVIKCS